MEKYVTAVLEQDQIERLKSKTNLNIKESLRLAANHYLRCNHTNEDMFKIKLEKIASIKR